MRCQGEKGGRKVSSGMSEVWKGGGWGVGDAGSRKGYVGVKVF